MAPKTVSGRVVKTEMTGGSGLRPACRRRPLPNGSARGALWEHWEAQNGTIASADPVLLGLQGGLGPVDGPQVVQQPLGVLRDLEEPLGDAALLHRGAAPLAEPRR